MGVQKMDNQTKIIFLLLALMVILTGIFVLKITGVIKPKPVEIKEVEEVKEEQKVQEDKGFKDYSNNYNNDYKYKSNFKYKEESLSDTILTFVFMHMILVRIVVFFIVVIVNIGVAKLYEKLSMPTWCINMQYISPFISFITAIPVVGGIISIIIVILQIATLAYYFESVGMSKMWAICPIVSFIILSIGIATSLSVSLFTSSTTPDTGELLSIIGMFLLLISGIAYIIATIRVGERMNKGTLFIIFLVLFPFIFQPILGYFGEPNRVTRFEENYNFDTH